MKKAFTLIEVNLAMLIMAGGILSIVGLYAFGFRESTQSREDVASAALADAYVSPLVTAISATNLRWSVFKNVRSFPNDDGWGSYLDNNGNISRDPDGKAQYAAAMSAYSGCAQGNAVSFGAPSDDGTMKCGLVVLHDPESPIVRIGFRATKNKNQLLAMPLYYTEVRFQGIIDQ